MRGGCKRLDTSTQGKYTKSKPASENLKDFNVSKRQSQILPLRPAFPTVEPSRGTIWGMKRVTILPNIVPCRIFTATRDGCGNQGDSRTPGCAVWLTNRDRGAAGPRSALPQEQTSKLDPPAIPSA